LALGLIGMDVNKMLQDLREEREQIEEAILSLERLARGRGKRRGRPPAWLSEMRKENKPAKGKATSSQAKPASA
jgi:hypothetical protein